MTANRVNQLRKMLEQVDPTRKTAGLEARLEAHSGAPRGASLEALRSTAATQETEMALESLDALNRGTAIDSDQRFVLEAVVMPYHRPVVDIVDDYLVLDQLSSTWAKLGNVPQQWITERTRAVGRLNVPNILYAGTGFVVGDGLLMTNRHVAMLFAQGLGTRNVQFNSGQSATIDFYHEKGRSTSESLKVEKVLLIHPYWDMALIKVSGLPATRSSLTLSTADPSTLKDREVAVIGYPGYDPNGDQEFQRVQSRIFRDTYYVKRFQPGLFRSRETALSYNRNVEAVTHDCSTLGGNSGSAVIDIQSGEVVGLHFGGAYLEANYAVSPFDLAQDSRVVDAGVKFQGRLEPRGDFYGPIWHATETSESPVPVPVDSPEQPPAVAKASASTGGPINQVANPTGQTVNFTIPVQVSVTIGNLVLGAPEPPPASTSLRGTSQLGAPVSDRRAPISTEGLFRRERPIPTAQVPAPFSVASLLATQFDWKTALSMALASRLSYEDESAVINTATAHWKLQSCKFFTVDDTQCLVASSADAVIVAFRGTESRGDWLGNLNAIGTTVGDGMIVHRGFLGAFQVVDAQLRTELSRFPGRRVLLTGHSLGGALATVAAGLWQNQFPISCVYTFGQPAVGKRNFPAFINRNYSGKFFRFVNDDDIVTRVPPTYRHVGTLYHFDASGKLKNSPESLVTELMTDPATAVTEVTGGPPMLTQEEFDRLRAELLAESAQLRGANTESVAVPVEEGLIPSVSDHSLDRYLAKIQAKAGA